MINKVITIASIILLQTFFIFSNQVGSTVSYFADTETSVGNGMKAALLDFTLDGSVNVGVGIEATTTPPTIVPIIHPEDGSLPLEYKIKSLKVSGDDNFCGQIDAIATDPFSFTGKLLSFITASTTSLDTLSLVLSLPASSTGIHYGDMCSVDLTYFGWHDGDGGLGYSDEEKITLNLHSISTSTDLMATSTSRHPLDEPIIVNTDPDKPVVPAGLLDDASTTPPISSFLLLTTGGGSESSTPEPEASTTPELPASTTDPVPPIPPIASSTPDVPPVPEQGTTTPETPPIPPQEPPAGDANPPSEPVVENPPASETPPAPETPPPADPLPEAPPAPVQESAPPAPVAESAPAVDTPAPSVAE